MTSLEQSFVRISEANQFFSMHSILNNNAILSLHQINDFILI